MDTIAEAAVVLGPRKMEIQDIEIPEIEKGGILIRMEMAGVCGSDLHLWRGLIPEVQYPMILGHENIGFIKKMGEGIENDITGCKLRLGDRVIWLPGYSCGKCYYCTIENEPLYCPNRTAYGRDLPPSMLGGGFARYMYLRPETSILKVPNNITSEAAVIACCAGTTLVQGIERVEIGFNDTVVVQGLGSLGLFGLALALKNGAMRTIVIDSSKRKSRIKFAEGLGADFVIDLERTSPKERVDMVKKITRNRGADIVIEATGVPEAVEEGIKMLGPRGKYLVLGQVNPGFNIQIDPALITAKSLRIIGSCGSKSRHIYNALKFIGQNESQLKKMVTHKFSLEKSEEALETYWAASDAITVVVTP